MTRPPRAHRAHARCSSPRGRVVAGASSHPGKFGFVALHNILARATRARSSRRTARAARSSASPMAASVDDLPAGAGRPRVRVHAGRREPRAAARVRARRACAAAFITSAGYGEAGDEGRAAEARARGARGRGARHAARGTERAGRVSTPAQLCAQIVAPYPPPGRIAIASQSGNFVSSFQNYAVQTGVGVSRAVSAGNAAAVTRRRTTSSTTPTTRETAVGARVRRGDHATAATFFDRVRAVAATQAARAAEGRSDRGRPARGGVAHRRAGARRPGLRRHVPAGRRDPRRRPSRRRSRRRPRSPRSRCPRGPRVAVLTTAGGWGVVTADAIAAVGARAARAARRPARRDRREASAPLEPEQPDRPRRRRDPRHDPRGARARRARTPSVDAVVYLGLGIQSNQARLMRDGPLLPRPRARADRRVPRAPGRALRAGGGRGLRRDRQADPHRDRARGRRPRQRRARGRSARPGGSATRRRTGPCARSSTSGGTRTDASAASAVSERRAS